MLTRWMRDLLLISCSTAVCFPATLPVGTELQVRLTKEASSAQKANAPIDAVLAVPVFLNGEPVLDSGAVLSGNTADVHQFQAGSGNEVQQAATLRLQFTKLRGSDGKQTSIFCVVSAVDNARETLDDSGLILGIDQSQTFGAQMDRGIHKLEERYGQVAAILNSMKGSIVKEVDPEITMKPGVDLTLKLTRALTLPAQKLRPAIGAVGSAELLATTVNSQPLRTAALKPPEPSDMTNIMFIGTEQQVKDAFEKAGWFAADVLSQASKMETARAIIENRGYNEAPMSVLTLEGRPPEFALQKQNDTFSKRHHIRIWQRPQTFNGEPIWVAAATHDISITFSPQSKSFTHGIDPNIDLERAKVVNDMLFTGTVKAVALVDRNNLPADPSNATGDKLITDGKMAVLQF